jgi:hypothetical protein
LCNFVRHPVNGVVWIDRESRKRAGQRPGGSLIAKPRRCPTSIARTRMIQMLLSPPRLRALAPGFAFNGSCQSPCPKPDRVDSYL